MTRPGVAAVLAIALALALPVSVASQDLDAQVARALSDAKAVARSRTGLELQVEPDGTALLARILEALRSQHRRQPLSRSALREEVIRWGTALGEILRISYPEAHWAESNTHNRKYGRSVFVPLEGGGWLESDDLDLVEHLITGRGGVPPGLPIETALNLHLLD